MVSRKEKMILHVPEREQSPDLLRPPQPLLGLLHPSVRTIKTDFVSFCYDPSDIML